jgi:glycosyltransferase involved in cell wall biosynthesis
VLADVASRRRPGVVLFAHGYLAAAAPPLPAPIAIDFADVEVRRMASLARTGPARARVAHGAELLKARRWEPGVARAATVASAVSPADVALLSSWGARAVLVPNGADRHQVVASPARGPVTFVAGHGYGPNRDAATFLVDHVWPRLRAADPEIRLRLVGRQADPSLGGAGVEVVADPPSVDRYYREASVVVAPVRAGGGAQLKVTEALARGRVVVATPFSAAAAPAGAGDGLVVARTAARFADCVLALWHDVAGRHLRERALAAVRPVPTWEDACAPLMDALARPARRR